MPADTDPAACVGRRQLSVFAVVLMTDISQVGDAIIFTTAIDVVDLPCGPLSMIHGVSHTVRSQELSENETHRITEAAGRNESQLSRKALVPAICGVGRREKMFRPLAPPEVPSLRIIL